MDNLPSDNIYLDVRQVTKKFLQKLLTDFSPFEFSYAMLHAARKIFSNVKSTIAEEWSTTANESTHPLKPDDVSEIRIASNRNERLRGV